MHKITGLFQIGKGGRKAASSLFWAKPGQGRIKMNKFKSINEKNSIEKRLDEIAEQIRQKEAEIKTLECEQDKCYNALIGINSKLLAE